MLPRCLPSLLPALLAAALVSGCSTPVPPEADLEVTARPMPLVGRDEKTVETYWKQFASYHSRKRRGIRTISANDRGKTISTEISAGVCRSVGISGRLGESLFPRSPGDLAEIRDAYAGPAAWQGVHPPAASGNGPLQGSYQWVSANPALEASATWTYTSPERKTAGYELTIRQP